VNRPDVAIVDVTMPAGGGPRAARGIITTSPTTRVIALSAHEDRATVLEMLRAGAVGYLVKGTAPEEILSAIDRVVRGQASLSAEVMGGVVSELSTQLRREELASAHRREREERIARFAFGEGLRVEYQPIVELGSRVQVGTEALARFDSDPVRAPDAWFREAVEVGLGIELELATVRRAVSALPRLPEPFYLSLNASHRLAVNPWFLEELDDIPGKRLVVEITEHEPVDDYAELSEALDTLRGRGIRIAIDDAGAGFSSLRHTLRIGPDILKIDMSITHDIHLDRGKRALASALASFADEMGIAVVAEGIEMEEEVATLSELGVPFGQGYLFGRPGVLPLTA
jgi:EAL domain-containing protein (putative c-di-GMP-specific phosphodiesterase class I)